MNPTPAPRRCWASSAPGVGIGLIYAENMRLWNWDVVMFITLLLVAVVMIMDTLSAWLRRRYIGGAAVPLYQGGR
ncbi:hypothetical protein BN1200_540022 [Klebsiella variicola]|nr:hypothetical protein BN1200_540022 [Klebsiella variicola]